MASSLPNQQHLTENLSDFTMDKYDYLLLDVIMNHKRQYGSAMRLNDIERQFWKRIEEDDNLSIGQARIGERVTRLYVEDFIQNREGYSLTRKGREILSFAPVDHMGVAS